MNDYWKRYDEAKLEARLRLMRVSNIEKLAETYSPTGLNFAYRDRLSLEHFWRRWYGNENYTHPPGHDQKTAESMQVKK